MARSIAVTSATNARRTGSVPISRRRLIWYWVFTLWVVPELVRLRASQINHCAYCIDMHTKDAHAEGDTEQRLYLVSAWREAPFYSDRERAALEWTEAVTKVGETHVPDNVFEQVRQHFDEAELVAL